MELVEGTRLKGYQLEERIGTGGFGAVYRARQSTINREVAIKIILPGYANQPDFIRRFESEALLIARLEHPHITPLHDFWRDPDGAYLVMRYLRGGSVRDALEDGPLALDAISLWLDQIASALDFAHRNEVIHRDIKPGNILLDEDGNTYLADFGIAKDLSNFANGNTAPDAVVGSLDYISPEQARSEIVTPRTDIYSLGVTLYEMITGHHPFQGVSSVERLYKHINDPLPTFETKPDVQDALNAVIQRATSKDPANRYPDVMTLAAAFRDVIGRGITYHDASIVEQLTMREHEILSMIVKGMSNRDIADELVVTMSTVKWHINQLYKKLGVRSRVQAIVRARELDLIVTGDTVDDLGDLEGALTAIALPEPENPYKGLHAFQTTDARDFFGRDELTQKLIDRLCDDDPYHRFLAIVGPSGSGKSSLVKAALIPALWKGAIPGSEKWFVVDMIPGARPLDKLETALIRVAANQANNLREQLQRDEWGLIRVADIILPADDTELVIVVDQFEEVFTLVEDEDARQQFLDLLRVAVGDVRSRVRVVVTLRADYYDRPLQYPEFGELIRNRMETVLPLSAKGLERAIRGPAERVSVTFEQGLVEHIVSAMNYQSGALPLLQYALTELFDRREERQLTHEAYQAIGGAVGALAHRTDEIFLSLTEEAQELAHQMFMRLVTLGEGAEDTRRRATHAELLSLTEDSDLMEEIIDQFAAYRLLSLDHDPETRQPTVEVAHEAILREWDRLRQWLNESREDIRQERAVSRAAEEWKGHHREPSYLLRGARLDQVERWRQITNLIQTPLVRKFIEQSVQQRAQEEQVEKARQQREAMLEQRSRTFLRGLAVVLTIAAIVSIIFGLLALQQRQRAENNAEEAQRQQHIAEDNASAFRSIALANGAQQALDAGQPDVALALAQEAIRMDNPPLASQQTYFEAATSTWMRHRFTGHTERLSDAVYSPDNSMAVTTSWDNTAMLWDTTTYEVLDTLEYADSLNGVDFHPTENLVAIGSVDGTLILWNLDTDAVDSVQIHDGWLWEVRFSPDGKSVAAVGEGNFAQIRDVETLELVHNLEGHSIYVTSVTWNTDSSRLMSGSFDNTIKIWDAATGEENMMLRPSDLAENEERGVFNVDFLPGDRQAITVHIGGYMYLWDTETGEMLHEFERHPDDIYGLDISSDGRFAVTSTNQPDSMVRLWDIETHQLIREYGGHTGRVQTAVFSPDERQILSAALDGTAILWDIFPPGMKYNIPSPTGGSVVSIHPDGQSFIDGGMDGLIYHRDLETGETIQIYDENEGLWPMALAFSGNGQYFASGDYVTFRDYEEQNAYLWDAVTGELVHILDEHNGHIWDVAYSPDGQLLAAAESLGTRIILWNTQSGEVEQILEGHTDEVYEVVFSGDGQTLYSASRDLTLREWDIATGETRKVYEGHTDRVTSLDVSPDDTQLLSASEDGTLILWDIMTGSVVRTFVGHTTGAYKARFSPDGRHIISGARTGNTLILWDTHTGLPLWRVAAHSLSTFWVHPEYTPDGTTIISVGDGGDIIAWDASAIPTNLKAWIAENRYVPDFTCEQRELYQIAPLCEADG